MPRKTGMPKRLADLVDRLPKEQRDRAATRRDEILREISLKQLRRALEAMGARLKIIAEFHNGEIVISQFHQKARGKARA